MSGIVTFIRQTEELKAARMRNYENIAEVTIWVERDDRPDPIEVVVEYEVEDGGYTGNTSAGHSEYVGDQAMFISAHTLDGREITLSETEIEEGISKLFGRNKR
jgi:hypothetical protein